MDIQQFNALKTGDLVFYVANTGVSGIFEYQYLGVFKDHNDNTMRTLKYNYIKVIQQNYGQGWEDASEYEATSTGMPKEISDKLSPKGKKETLLMHDLREYRLLGYPTKVIFRKEKINTQTA